MRLELVHRQTFVKSTIRAPAVQSYGVVHKRCWQLGRGEWSKNDQNCRQIVQSNLGIRNGLIRNKLVLKNHFPCPWPFANLLPRDKEYSTKKFPIIKFDCTTKLPTWGRGCQKTWKIPDVIYGWSLCKVQLQHMYWITTKYKYDVQSLFIT